MNAKKWTKEEIAIQISTSDAWLYRGLIALYERELENRKNPVQKREKDKGFNFNSDTSYTFLMSVCRYLKSKHCLTVKQKKYARMAIVKYCGQLARIANNEI